MRGIGTITVVQEPRAEPMALAEAKAHCRITAANPDEDALVNGLISAAREHTEAILQRPLVLQTIELALDQFHDEVRLDRGPVMKFGSVQYRDNAGALQTLATTVYQLDFRREPGRLTRAYAQVWPQLRGGEDINSVIFQYQVGYLAPIASVNAAGDLLTVKDNPFVDGDKVYASASGGELPNGLSAETPYYVRDTVGEAFALSATAGGSVLDIASAGSGNLYLSKRRFPNAIKQAMLLMIGHWYENREDTISGTIIASIPRGARALLAPYRMRAFS